jgi:anti-anti-sigma factor
MTGDPTFAVHDLGGTIAISGELDMAGVRRLDEALRERTMLDDLVLDLADLTFVDSYGIRALLDLAVRLRPHRLILRRARPEVAKVIELTGLTVFPTVVLLADDDAAGAG